jgi:hypothetical protein
MSEARPNATPNGDELSPNSSDSPLIIIDGPWDTTVRPRPPHIPRHDSLGESPAHLPKPPTEQN